MEEFYQFRQCLIEKGLFFPISFRETKQKLCQRKQWFKICAQLNVEMFSIRSLVVSANKCGKNVSTRTSEKKILFERIPMLSTFNNHNSQIADMITTNITKHFNLMRQAFVRHANRHVPCAALISM